MKIKSVGQLRKIVRQTYSKKRIRKDLVSLYKQNPDASAFELEMKLKKKYIKEVNVKAKPLGYKAYLDKESSRESSLSFVNLLKKSTNVS